MDGEASISLTLGERSDPSRPESVYERLREAILSLRLLPGQRVSERGLERLLGSSRTPIREALLRLESEGLVLREERGQRVAPIDLAELLEVFEYREEVEAAAVRLACRRALPADIGKLRELIDAGLEDESPETWYAIGTDVHVGLARLSGNRFLVRAVQDVVTRIARARWMMATSPECRRHAHHEHSEILRLIAERRPEEAAAAVVEHSRIVREKLADAIRQHQRGLRARGMDVVD